MSSETTFQNTCDPHKLFEICDELCADLAKSLQNSDEHPLRGRQVTVKVKTYRFDVKTKVISLSSPTSDYEVIRKAARQVLKQLMDSGCIDHLAIAVILPHCSLRMVHLLLIC